jgi:predicted helicase
LQSGLISKEQLAYKYQQEIHANEIVLLAYYIAAINIEQVYHDTMGGEYLPFNGICLTDTFALYEREDLATRVPTDNSNRRKKQKGLDIRVIMGNPPYSIGQEKANDNNQNLAYPHLDSRIRNTYAAHSSGGNARNLYDSYIRAIRWASDRIGESGVIGFVTNAGFLETSTADGLRHVLAKEFSNIYIFHLRGNARTSGELRKKERDNVFGQGTRTPIAISILVKNPHSKGSGNIYFHDIGDYLSQEEKLTKIESFGSIQGISAANGWSAITPDEHNDWLNQRDNSFSEFYLLGSKKAEESSKIFSTFSLGVTTNRDAWCYNASKAELCKNISSMMDVYNSEASRYEKACVGVAKKEFPDVDDFVNKNPKQIAWSRGLKQQLSRGKRLEYEEVAVTPCLYRPFSKQWLYFNRRVNEYVYQMRRFFPRPDFSNLVICISGVGAKKGYTALMSNVPVDLNLLDAGVQCFPLNVYDLNDDETEAFETPITASLFDEEPAVKHEFTLRHGITDQGLKDFQDVYAGETIAKEDLFYYVYGMLHSPDYRTSYADNLSKEMPRIPAVKTAPEFWAYSRAGRELAELHTNYEQAAPYPVQFEGGALLLNSFSCDDFKVQQMKYGKGQNGDKHDKTRVIYNHKITMTGIPLAAYEYVVNGRPALEWVMERQTVSEHKDSGIINDANLWATQTMDDPAYSLKLFQRVITVSLKTMEIVKSLPRL